MKIMKSIATLASAGVVAAGLTLSSVVSAAAGGVLKAPEPDWTGGIVTCRVISKLLESELGYKVKRITMPSGPTVREGIRAGDLDYACESWPSYDSTKEKYVKEYGGDGSVAKLGDAGIVGVSSYYVPRYLVEGDGAKAPDLKTYKDMNKYTELFKTLETGDKGRLIGCPVAAWECQDTKRMEILGLNYEVTELGSEAAHWAEIQSAYKRKEPFIAYAWEPHWIHAALDLVAVELPPHSDDAWPGTGWAKDVTYNYGSPKLAEEHPKAAELIINSYLTNDQQAGMIHAVDVEGKDVDEVVDAWLAENEAVWKAWLPSGS